MLLNDCLFVYMSIFLCLVGLALWKKSNRKEKLRQQAFGHRLQPHFPFCCSFFFALFFHSLIHLQTAKFLFFILISHTYKMQLSHWTTEQKSIFHSFIHSFIHSLTRSFSFPSNFTFYCLFYLLLETTQYSLSTAPISLAAYINRYGR